MSSRAQWFLSKCICDLGNHPPDPETRFTLLEWYMPSPMRHSQSQISYVVIENDISSSDIKVKLHDKQRHVHIYTSNLTCILLRTQC